MIAIVWSRWAKLLLPALMITMHVGIVMLQNILFPDLIAILALMYVLPLLDRPGGPWDIYSLLRRRGRSSAANRKPDPATAASDPTAEGAALRARSRSG